MIFIRSILVLAFMLSATGAMSQVESNWILVGRSLYPGGNYRLAMTFEVDVETRNLALIVPQYCAPRALASRAVVVDEYSGWTRQVGLTFRGQKYVGGNIQAFYTVDDSQNTNLPPLLRGAVFSFAQTVGGSQRACRIDAYVLPSGD